MLTMRPGRFGLSASGAARVTRLPYCAYEVRSWRMVAGEMPLVMLSFRYRSNQSRLTDQPCAGSNTMPADHCFDFSGCRFGLPPNTTPNCVAQLMPVLLVTGQRTGSDRPVAETPWMLGVHNW